MADYSNPPADKSANIALLGYLLLLAAPLLMISALIGVVIAYVYRDDAPAWLQSHFQLQIRTFWIGTLLFVSGLLLMWVVIGKLVLLLTLIWYLVRLIKGLKYLHRRAPYPTPESLGF